MLTLLYLRKLCSDDIKLGVKMDLGTYSYKPLNYSLRLNVFLTALTRFFRALLSRLDPVAVFSL